MYWDEVIPEGNSNYPHPAKMRRNTQSDILETQSQDPYSLEPSSLDPRLLESRATNKANEHFFDTMADDEDGEDLRSEENDDIDMMDAEDDFVIDDDGAGYAETPEERQRMQALHQQRLNLSRMGGNQYQHPVVLTHQVLFNQEKHHTIKIKITEDLIRWKVNVDIYATTLLVQCTLYTKIITLLSMLNFTINLHTVTFILPITLISLWAL